MTDSEYQELIPFLGRKFTEIDRRFDTVDERFRDRWSHYHSKSVACSFEPLGGLTGLPVGALIMNVV
jgi:hypothetical protein